MFLLRLLALLALIAIGVGIGAYVFTRQPAYLAFSWRVLRYGVVLALLIFALLVLERLAVIAL